MQKGIHTICDGNSIPFYSKAYDGNVSDMVMNCDSIEFLNSHTDIGDRLLIADCKMVAGDIIGRMLELGTYFIMKVSTKFSGKIMQERG
ncbi:hypothetical protein [Methanomethylophilus alvi]|uniref:hypothetical protein n=1 Tax=Methanomethylophilus alvi TaxID=1291540 RepID=UPI0037DD556C